MEVGPQILNVPSIFFFISFMLSSAVWNLSFLSQQQIFNWSYSVIPF